MLRQSVEQLWQLAKDFKSRCMELECQQFREETFGLQSKVSQRPVKGCQAARARTRQQHKQVCSQISTTESVWRRAVVPATERTATNPPVKLTTAPLQQRRAHPARAHPAVCRAALDTRTRPLLALTRGTLLALLWRPMRMLFVLHTFPWPAAHLARRRVPQNTPLEFEKAVLQRKVQVGANRAYAAPRACVCAAAGRPTAVTPPLPPPCCLTSGCHCAYPTPTPSASDPCPNFDQVRC